MKRSTTVILTLICMLFSVGCSMFAPDEAPPDPELDSSSPCLLYISRNGEEAGIVRDCVDGGMQHLVQGGEIEEIAAANNAKEIVFISSDAEQGDQLWLVDNKGKKKEIFSCDESECENLAISPKGDWIFVSLSGPRTGLLRYDLTSGEEILISNNGADFVDLSPDGIYFRFLEKETGLLRVLTMPDLEVVFSFATDIDLIGGWSHDSRQFLIGEREATGNLNVVTYREVDMASRQSTELFSLPTGTDYYQPIYSGYGTLYALVRAGLRNNTRQVQEIDRQGKFIRVISDAAGYDHFSLDLSPDGNFLAFQRYDLTSSQSVPQIAIWDVRGQSLLLAAENAIRPRWVR